MGGLMTDFAKEQVKKLFKNDSVGGLSDAQINLALAFIKRLEAIEYEIAQGKAATRRINAAFKKKNISLEELTPLFDFESENRICNLKTWL